MLMPSPGWLTGDCSEIVATALLGSRAWTAGRPALRPARVCRVREGPDAQRHLLSQQPAPHPASAHCSACSSPTCARAAPAQYWGPSVLPGGPRMLVTVSAVL